MAATVGTVESLGLLIVVAGLQFVFANYWPPALYVDFSLILVLYIGWYSSPFRGALWGMAFGLIQDWILGGLWGLNGLSKTVLGFSAHYLSMWVMLEGVVARLVLITLLSLLDSGIVYGMLHLLGQPLGQGVWTYALIKALVTGVAGGLIFRLYDRVKFPPKDFRRIEA